MDSQVKERIVGAAVLVAIGVWFFPWILDGSGTDEDASAPLESPVLAPAEDVLPVRTETVNLEPVEPDPEQEPEPTSADTAEPPAASVAESGSPADTPAAPADAQPDSASSQPESTAQMEAVADTPEREQPAVELAPPEPEPPAPVASNDEESGWRVQLGSFGEEANARQLAGRVADYGFDARVTEFETRGGLLHRVRISGYSSRAQAEAAVSSLIAHGFVAQVVAPEE